MKNHNDRIGIRTRDLPACSAVPQATASPRTPPPGLTLKNYALYKQSKFTCLAWISEQTVTCALYDNDNSF
jgi:hypothetical protein